MMAYTGAIFDMDGTLIDSMCVWEEIDRRFFERRGLTVPPGFAAVAAGFGMKKTAEYVIEQFGFKESADALIAEWMEMCLEEYATNIRMKDGACAYLSYLHRAGVKIGLATNSPLVSVRAVLGHWGVLSLFDAITTGEEGVRHKGFPDIYERTAEKMGLSATDCVVFEDIVPGIEGAHAGGFYAVGVHDDGAQHYGDKMRRLSDRFVMRLDELIGARLFEGEDGLT